MSASSQRRLLHWHLRLDRYLFPEHLWQGCCTGPRRITDLDENPDTNKTLASATEQTLSTVMSSSYSSPSFLSSTSSSTIASSLRKHRPSASQDKPNSLPPLSGSLNSLQCSTLVAFGIMSTAIPTPTIVPMPLVQSCTRSLHTPSSSTSCPISPSSMSTVGANTKRTHLAAQARALTALTSTTVDGHHTRSKRANKNNHKAHQISSCNRVSLKRSGRACDSTTVVNKAPPPPCTVRCFSPLDLPPELFVYFMRFLSPSDLWKLCQVSRAMQVAILQSLLPMQAVSLNVVRTLHQENGDSSCCHGRLWYEHMTLRRGLGVSYSSSLSESGSTPPSSFLPSSRQPLTSSIMPSLFSVPPSHSASSSHLIPGVSNLMSHQGGPSTSLFTAIPGRPKIQGQVQRRSDYWRMQAKRLVAIVSEYRDDDSHNHISGTSDGIGGKRFKRALSLRYPSMFGSDGRSATTKTTNTVYHLSSVSNHSAHGYVGVNNDLANNSHTHAGTSQGQQQQLESMQSSSSPVSPLPSIPIIARAPSRPPLPPLTVHNTAPTISKESRTAGIPRERLMILVDMIFDPLLVALENRRAIINCARYVSAEVDFVHKDTINLLKQTDPNHPLLRGDNRDVYLGPYLTIAQPHMNQSSGWAAFNEVTPAVTTEPLATPPPTPGTMDESPSPMATQGEKDEHYWLTHVEPPARLRSFFQRLLWHRCLSDLVRIYNQIQERHIPTPASGQTIRDCKASSPFSSSPSPPLFAVSDSTAQYKRPEDNSCTTSLPSHTPALAATTQGPHQTQEAIYPFCCKAHSLVFSHSPNTLNGPFSSATTTASLFSASWMTSSRYTLFGLRTKLKQAMNDLQRAYRQFQWTLSALGFDQTPLDLQRIVQPAFRPSKLVFCNAISIKEPSMAILPKGSSLQDQKQQRQTKNDDQVTDHEHHKDRESHYASHRLSEEELLVRRRYLIDDAVRRDNLMKQELLGLCHIACGLFTVDTANPQGTTADGNTRRSSRYQPVTLMSLLRQGSPWRKGVWQEGEWRSSAIELDPMAAPNDPSSSSIPWNAQEAEAEQGEWQKICLATIQFLIREDLAWGGNKANEELSKLKVTNYGSAWVYHE